MKEKIAKNIKERFSELDINDKNFESELIQSYFDEFDELIENGISEENAFEQVINKIDELNILIPKNQINYKNKNTTNIVTSILCIFSAIVLNCLYIMNRQLDLNYFSIILYIAIDLVIFTLFLLVFLIGNRNSVFVEKDKKIYRFTILSILTNLIIFIPSILAESFGSDIIIKDYFIYFPIALFLIINLFRILLKDKKRKFYVFSNIALILSSINSFNNNEILSFVFYSLSVFSVLWLLILFILYNLKKVSQTKMKILIICLSIIIAFGIDLFMTVITSDFELFRICVIALMLIISLATSIDKKSSIINIYSKLIYCFYFIGLLFVKFRSIIIIIKVKGFDNASICYWSRQMSSLLGIIIMIIFFFKLSKSLYKTIREE